MNTGATAAAVICENVCVAFNGQDVVSNVHLRIDIGTFLPFVGGNGAGKTTLLRAILGLQKLRQGRIQTFCGSNPIGYVPQQRVIDPLLPMSMRQLVTMGIYNELGWHRRLSPTQQQRLDAVLARLDLDAHADKTFAELSGGMKQKALIARAIVSGAELFVLDEPTSELDAVAENMVLNILLELTQQGKTVMLAHHNMAVLAELAPMVCYMNHGKAQIITLAQLREQNSCCYVNDRRQPQRDAEC